jgi:tetratricopeptide (TPR) repeat protein
MCTSDDKVVNATILKGRILQRMAQIYLVSGNKKEAVSCFEHASECLQFVGRGYDRGNMLCRRAKILSATSPEKREEIEATYIEALQNVSDSDSFVLASKPSLILSKAAFHLHISFGVKINPDSILEPEIHTNDMEKAQIALSALSEDMILLDMRKCEHKLIQAELLRLSEKYSEAIDLFSAVIEDSSSKNLINLTSIATQRRSLSCIELDKIKLTDELLKDLPIN